MTWAEKSCEKNAFHPTKGTNLREQLSESLLHLIPFNRIKIEDFAPRNAKYIGLFTIWQLAEVIQIIACKEFKPNLFTAKPISYEIFTLDEKRILEFSLSDRLRASTNCRSNLEIEAIHLCSKKSIFCIK